MFGMFGDDGAVTVSVPWFGLLLQGGSFAVLVYLLVWAIPGWRREMAREQAEEREHFNKVLDRLIATSDERYEKLAQAIFKGRNGGSIQR